jgi:hypothetical protein
LIPRKAKNTLKNIQFKGYLGAALKKVSGMKIRLESDGKTIRITDFFIIDQDLHRELQEMEEANREEYLERVIKVGTQGIRRMNISGEVDFVEKQLNKLEESLESKIDEHMKSYFGEEGAIDTKLASGIETPFVQLKEEVKKSIDDLRVAVITQNAAEEARQEITEQTTLKGYDFEDNCEIILDNFISSLHNGDQGERTTNKPGEIGTTTGDYTITTKDNKIISLETKSYKNLLTFEKIFENLERGMTNRKAQYGILVSRNKEALPKSCGIFNEPRQNMLICALGSEKTEIEPKILELAYQWARMRVVQKNTLKEQEIHAIVNSITELEQDLKDFTQIQAQCTEIGKSTDKIREISDELRGKIKSKITQIQRAFNELEEEAPQPKIMPKPKAR